jgi:hypothetical protein
VVHDLRRTAHKLMTRSDVRVDVGELALGHSIKGIRAHYDDPGEYQPMIDAAVQAVANEVERILTRRATTSCRSVLALLGDRHPLPGPGRQTLHPVGSHHCPLCVRTPRCGCTGEAVPPHRRCSEKHCATVAASAGMSR